MPVRAEFVGGPKDGDTTVLQAAMPFLHVHPMPQGITWEDADKPPSPAEKPSVYDVYRLREGTPLGLSTGYVFYDYDGRRR